MLLAEFVDEARYQRALFERHAATYWRRVAGGHRAREPIVLNERTARRQWRRRALTAGRERDRAGHGRCSRHRERGLQRVRRVRLERGPRRELDRPVVLVR